MRVVFASARSSPGVTTAALACASVWPGRVLLVEASEDGGVLPARFGLPDEPGLTSLSAQLRHGRDDVDLASHCQPAPGTAGRLTALVGSAAIGPARLALRTVAPQLGRLLDDATLPATVLIDAGRLTAEPLLVPLVAAADRLVLVVRPRLEELRTLAHRLPALTELGAPTGLLLVGDRPYGPGEVGGALGVPVVGVLAHDPAAAAALEGTPARGLRRSRLLRSAAGVVDRLTGGDRPVADATGETNEIDDTDSGGGLAGVLPTVGGR